MFLTQFLSDAIVVARWVYNVLIERENLPRPAGDARDVLSMLIYNLCGL